MPPDQWQVPSDGGEQPDASAHVVVVTGAVVVVVLVGGTVVVVVAGTVVVVVGGMVVVEVGGGAVVVVVGGRVVVVMGGPFVGGVVVPGVTKTAPTGCEPAPAVTGDGANSEGKARNEGRRPALLAGLNGD